MFDDSSGQVIVGDLARNSTEGRERMHMTTDKCFESLTVSEFQVQHAAVRLD